MNFRAALFLLWPWAYIIEEHFYRRAGPDCSRLRIFVEEAPRMKDHKPALVTKDDGTINIIPSVAWPADPYMVHVISHESDHLVLMARLDMATSQRLDHLPRTPLSELFARAGVYGWDELTSLKEDPKWLEMMIADGAT